MLGPQVTLTFQSRHQVEKVFAFIVHPDTPIKLVRGWAFLPGFKGYQLLDGDYRHEGARRIDVLNDASTCSEVITALKPFSFFEYEISNFSDPILKLIVKKGLGQWWFVPNEGGTKITWRYTFEPASSFSSISAYLFVKYFYSQYMLNAVKEFKALDSRPG